LRRLWGSAIASSVAAQSLRRPGILKH